MSKDKNQQYRKSVEFNKKNYWIFDIKQAAKDLNFDIEKHNIRRIEFETLHSDGFLAKGKNYNSCIEKLITLGYKATEAGEYNEAYEL